MFEGVTMLPIVMKYFSAESVESDEKKTFFFAVSQKSAK